MLRDRLVLNHSVLPRALKGRKRNDKTAYRCCPIQRHPRDHYSRYLDQLPHTLVVVHWKPLLQPVVGFEPFGDDLPTQRRDGTIVRLCGSLQGGTFGRFQADAYSL